jgi:hypothetical protein
VVILVGASLALMGHESAGPGTPVPRIPKSCFWSA